MSELSWISLADAMPANLSDADVLRWRKEILERLQAGKLQARASRHTSEYVNLKSEEDAPDFVKFKVWMASHGVVYHKPSWIRDEVALDLEFWSFIDVTQADRFDTFDFGYATYSDWNRGDFGLADMFTDEFGDERHSVRIQNAIDVKVHQSLIDKINRAYVRHVRVKSPSVGAPVKYPWEQAMAYLVAVAEFDALAPDPEAAGALAAIERKLYDWFVEHSSEIPSETSIRSRAQMVLTAIRREAKN